MKYLLSLLFLASPIHAHEVRYAPEQICQDLNVVIQRIDIATANIVNANTTRTATGGPYKPQVVTNCQKGICEITVSDESNILKYLPNHPDADENGYVAYPNVSVLEEMESLKKAQRAYELIINAGELESKEVLAGKKYDKCFKKYPAFAARFDLKNYLGR